MWTQHNPRLPLGAIAMISKKHTLIKFRGKIELVHEINCLWPLIVHQQIVSQKPRISWALSLYIYIQTSVQNYFRNASRKTSKFTWNDVYNWFNLTVSFSSEYWYICFIFMLRMWTINLTESTNNFCTSDRAVRTINVNMKERFIGNDGFLQIFIWWINCS